ncbi:hypothetical protein PV325_007493 [Microctonus aethiopoides]|nr:hypothetical protein PV325_007493 [Microctonus aethiopoides]
MSKNKEKLIKSHLSNENQIDEEVDNESGSPTSSLSKLLQQYDIQEIDRNEIEIGEVVGHGSFGVVRRGRWRGFDIAIKDFIIHNEKENKSLMIEVKYLSSIAHPNIIRIYGVCTENPISLIMEYAEGGSLFNALHCERVRYTFGDAMSWALQCARAVKYLHNIKPKALIHRDLKSPNLLLINGNKTLKLCDFGTVTALKTNMTNNAGSGLWMAPEVFSGSTYSEKCDIYSWSVILWEVFSRKIPFYDTGKSPTLVAYAVWSGLRPPVFDFIPIPIQCLLKRCWTEEPEDRPAMNEIVGIMSLLQNALSEHLDVPNAWDTDSSSEIQNIAGLDVTGPKNEQTIDRKLNFE